MILCRNIILTISLITLSVVNLVYSACVSKSIVPCAQNLYFTNSFGDSKLSGAIIKQVDLTGLSSITVYSGNYLDAIQFNYTNGIIEYFGSSISSDISSIVEIDMANKLITGINLKYDLAINCIQFQIYDLKTDITTLTQVFGGNEGVFVPLTFGYPFVFNSLYGLSNQNNIQFLIFGYYSFDCQHINSLNLNNITTQSITGQCYLFSALLRLGDESNNYGVPSTIPTTTLLVTTTTTTITTIKVTLPITTTALPLAFVRHIHNGSFYSHLLGDNMNPQITTTLSPGVDKYSVQLSELSSITIHSGSFIQAFEFFHLDGTSETHGSIQNSKFITTVNLKYLRVTAMKLRVDWLVRSIQFQLFDPSQNTYSWTEEIGNQKIGNQLSIEHGLFDDAKMMNIYELSGVFIDNYPTKLDVSTLYIDCNS